MQGLKPNKEQLTIFVVFPENGHKLSRCELSFAVKFGYERLHSAWGGHECRVLFLRGTRQWFRGRVNMIHASTGHVDCARASVYSNIRAIIHDRG